jgi:hypothetical protein
MKTRKSILVAISILAIFVLIGTGATGKKTCVAGDSEKYCGTWVNPDYNGNLTKWAKYILKPDGTWMLYSNDSDTAPHRYGAFTITEEWTDSEGNIWFKETGKCQDHYVHYSLYKLSNSGKSLEFVWSLSDYPAEMDPNHPHYHIYYRK